MAAGGGVDAADGPQPFLLEAEAFLEIVYKFVGLADLPVGAVQDPHHPWGRRGWEVRGRGWLD